MRNWMLRYRWDKGGEAELMIQANNATTALGRALRLIARREREYARAEGSPAREVWSIRII